MARHSANPTQKAFVCKKKCFAWGEERGIFFGLFIFPIEHLEFLRVPEGGC